MNWFKANEGVLSRGYLKCRAYFQGESSKIGDGWRIVFAKEGKRTVLLLSPNGSDKLDLKQWREMDPEYVTETKSA